MTSTSNSSFEHPCGHHRAHPLALGTGSRGNQPLKSQPLHGYTPEQVNRFVALFLGGAERDQLDPTLDACAATYTDTLDEDGQVDFKGKTTVFCRT